MEYHDKEWGVPVYDDQLLFEFLILEGAQAGLSWQTILQRRGGYRAAFDNFVIEKVARYTSAKMAHLVENPNIIRNRLKIASTVQNARTVLAIQEEQGSFADYLWQFVDGQPIINHWRTLTDVPTSTAISDTMSKALKKRGFSFVGTTICYTLMQAVGMVNDHMIDCFRHKQLSTPKRKIKPCAS
jgi:DNA-3-methyladenine glycosylase I